MFINLDRDCTPFESCYGSILSRFDNWGLEDLVSAHRVTYVIEANWKIVFQNYNECYHCSLVHPQLSPVTSVETASNDFTEGAFLGGPMILSDNCETISTDGALCGDLFPRLLQRGSKESLLLYPFPDSFHQPPSRLRAHSPHRKARF